MTLDQIEAIIRENDICVLATTGADGPHTSLMAYTCSADVRCIYLVTPKNTLKYRNMCAQSRVSLMIDTRTQDTRGEVRALTINGRIATIEETADAAAIRTALLRRHPHLQYLMEQPDVVIVGMVIDAVQMLSGPVDAYRIRFPINQPQQ